MRVSFRHNQRESNLRICLAHTGQLISLCSSMFYLKGKLRFILATRLGLDEFNITGNVRNMMH